MPLLLRAKVERDGTGAGANEQASWENSLPALAKILVRADRADVEIYIEVDVPHFSGQADAVLHGVHPQTSKASFVVVELKQWTDVTLDGPRSALCRVPHYRRPKPHPVAQVRKYVHRYLAYHPDIAEDPDGIVGIAYLHNAGAKDAAAIASQPEDLSGMLYTADTEDLLVEALARRFAPQSATHVADDPFSSVELRTPRPQSAVLAGVLAGEEQFELLGDQNLAYGAVMKAVNSARMTGGRHAVVVTGGPGTGKTAIAIQAVADLLADDAKVKYATGSSALLDAIRKVSITGRELTRRRAPFVSLRAFAEAAPGALDVIICDEAHRISEVSKTAWWTSPSGKSQLAELMDAAPVTVFLLDAYQTVRADEIGTNKYICETALARGMTLWTVDLHHQFRCSGSLEYVEWTHRLLGLDEHHSAGPWSGRGMQVQVVDRPEDMDAVLAKERQRGASTRIAAGFCWPWTKMWVDGKPVDDIVIGNWRRPWNTYKASQGDPFPPAPLWAVDDRGTGQIGCIYTAQGLEYDWAGVIIGEDLVWRDGRWLTDPGKCSDRKAPKRDPLLFERYVKHVYKVLLTRGRLGTVIYACDEETRAHLKKLISRETVQPSRAVGDKHNRTAESAQGLHLATGAMPGRTG
ncbi:DUF2075 domain-containing protein [Uniformispora flossi]|uniref:DUF2075 domain-containing protein n=1 Tax=Uniformispora flossi TaxID=3390723 RepID=UPI003C2DE95C